VPGEKKIVNLDLKWYRTQLNMINLILTQVGTYQTTPRFIYRGRYINWQEVTYLQAVWEQLNLEFQDIEKLLPVTRQKISLLNFGGIILNFLFEIATNANFQTLHQVVKIIKGQQATITHSLEH